MSFETNLCCFEFQRIKKRTIYLLRKIKVRNAKCANYVTLKIEVRKTSNLEFFQSISFVMQKLTFFIIRNGRKTDPIKLSLKFTKTCELILKLTISSIQYNNASLIKGTFILVQNVQNIKT